MKNLIIVILVVVVVVAIVAKLKSKTAEQPAKQKTLSNQTDLWNFLNTHTPGYVNISTGPTPSVVVVSAPPQSAAVELSGTTYSQTSQVVIG